MSDSGDQWSWSLDGDSIGGMLPYTLREFRNELILTGCNVQVTLLNRSSRGGLIVNGCASFCSATLLEIHGKMCSNIGCCQSSISVGYASYSLQLKRVDSGLPKPRKDMVLPDEANVVNVIIAEAGWLWLNKDRISDLALGRTAAELKVPVILRSG